MFVGEDARSRSVAFALVLAESLRAHRPVVVVVDGDSPSTNASRR
jgi:hypothetical protein